MGESCLRSARETRASLLRNADGPKSLSALLLGIPALLQMVG